MFIFKGIGDEGVMEEEVIVNAFKIVRMLEDDIIDKFFVPNPSFFDAW